MTSLPSRARSAAWAGLLQEQRGAAPAPVESRLSRVIGQCRLARTELAASFADADRQRPAPRWLRDWMSCIDDLLAVTERLHAHVQARTTE